jgi:hypothetical protein
MLTIEASIFAMPFILQCAARNDTVSTLDSQRAGYVPDAAIARDRQVDVPEVSRHSTTSGNCIIIRD